MANTIKQKRGTTDPGASDLVVGELAINTTDGGVFTKTDGGTVVEVGSGGASEINDLSDGVTNSSGVTLGLGTDALASDDGTSNNNTAVGYQALYSNTTGSSNTANGFKALRANTTGPSNTANGIEALLSNTTGEGNTANGRGALYSNTIGSNNTANGWAALLFNTTGINNTANGKSALQNNTTGAENVALGHQAGDNITTGDNNIVIGYQADASSATVSDEITLGNSSITSLRIPGLQSGASDGQVLTFNSTNGNITLADAGGGVTYELIEQGDSKASGSYIDISDYKAVYGVFHNDPGTNSANRDGPYLSTSNSSNTGVSTQNSRYFRMGANSGWWTTSARYQQGNYNPSTSAIYYGSNTTGDFDKVWKLHLMGLDQTNVFIEAYSENNGSGPSYQTTNWSGTTTSGSSTWYLYIHQALARYQIYGVK
jgi:trimeric autotransporter adhesin